MPVSEDKITAFYIRNKAIQFNFSGESVSSEGGALLLAAVERKHKILKSFSGHIPDARNPLFVIHEYEKQVQQRVFLLAQGYSDCNDAAYLKNDPVISNLLSKGLASQPTLCRLENNISEETIFELEEWFIDKYVSGLPSKQELIVIDVDSTDDPTHGGQQMSLFNGYYDQWMYQEMLLIDGISGQLIMPRLLSGTGDCRVAFVEMLKMAIEKIRARFPGISILVRGDAGFSCPEFYNLGKEFDLLYCLGIAANPVLKKITAKAEKRIRKQFLSKKLVHQEIIGPRKYQAKSWDSAQRVFAKVEATKEGMNTRFIASNMTGITGEQIYWDFYVMRGETCENRIKEIKTMCFSDRLSCTSFTANCFRLMLSCLAYEFVRMIKIAIQKTKHEEPKKWAVNNIRLFLFKIGAIVKEKVRSVIFQLSSTCPHQNLFKEIISLC